MVTVQPRHLEQDSDPGGLDVNALLEENARLRAQVEMLEVRVRRDEELRRARDELEQRVRERTAELTHANERLRREMAERQQAEAQLRQQQEMLFQHEKLAAMGSLLASVAHELHNPLSIVMMQADLLREELQDGPMTDQAQAITQSAERCARIVRNFLTVARQHPPERQWVDLNRVVQEAVELLAYALQGDTIEVELQVGAEPMVEPAPPVVVALKSAQAKAQAVLVVDDEPGIASALAYLLSRSGYAVDTAANGRLALDKLQERTYDLILCDLRMPELDGPGLYRELEERYPQLRRRVVFLTGDTLSPEAREFLEKVDVARLSKPFRAAEVRWVVHQALQAS